MRLYYVILREKKQQLATALYAVTCESIIVWRTRRVRIAADIALFFNPAVAASIHQVD